jgi:hypothetical protein
VRGVDQRRGAARCSDQAHLAVDEF